MTRIAIAGAGIAGLSMAVALARQGADVVVLEAAPVLTEAGAGVQLSPNATRVLAALDLLPAVEASAVKPEAIRIRRARDGAELARLPLTNATRRYGAPFLVTHRADLQAALLGAVRAHPRITLRTGVPLTGLEATSSGVAARIAGGEAVEADGLVGADGLHSRIRPWVVADAPLRRSGRLAWRSLVPTEAAPSHARATASTLWLGPGAHLVHYPVRGGALINVVAIVEERRRVDPLSDDWAVPGDPGELRRAFAGWCPEARSLLDAAPDWRVWPLCDRAPLPHWSRGAVTLAGDAAHPMLPFLAQGAAQAVEDAGAFAACLSRAPRFDAAAVAYEQARRDKAARVQREARRQARVYHLPAPASLARDAAFRLLGPDRMLARYDWLYGQP